MNRDVQPFFTNFPAYFPLFSNYKPLFSNYGALIQPIFSNEPCCSTVIFEFRFFRNLATHRRRNRPGSRTLPVQSYLLRFSQFFLPRLVQFHDQLLRHFQPLDGVLARLDLHARQFATRRFVGELLRVGDSCRRIWFEQNHQEKS